MVDVCLVLMPYAAVERPSIALGLLKACLRDNEIETAVLYPNLWFAEEIGLNVYQGISFTYPELFLGEWTFSGAAFPDFNPDHNKYLQLIQEKWLKSSELQNPFNISDLSATCLQVRQEATAFIDKVAQSVLDLQPRIVACSSTFQQHCASLALLRRIRELAPEIITFMGGANCEAEMGRATKQEFPWVDYVISGEGDEIIAPLCQLLLTEGRQIDPKRLPYGVISSESLEKSQTSVVIAPRASVQDLSRTPIPDYDDYFQELARSPLVSYIKPTLPVETSRGCWWGQLHHCTFCGLNGSSLGYRSKSPQRVAQELSQLSQRYGLQQFEAVDNILDTAYIEALFPYLAALPKRYSLFYETKANLTYAQLKQLADAGVRSIQPGIESMHNSILKLINKGSTSWINVQTIKWAEELGIQVYWLFLVGIPGESDAWYGEMASWLPLIAHLQPPADVFSVQYHRFSPYHQRPTDFGLTLTPNRSYQYIYPVGLESLNNLAYYFEDTSTQTKRKVLTHSEKPDHSGLKAMISWVYKWINLWKNPYSNRPVLDITDDGEQIHIQDTRPCAVDREQVIAGLAYWVYITCNQALSSKELLKTLRKMGLANSWEEIQPVVEELQKRKILLNLDGRLLSLGVRKPRASKQKAHEHPCGQVDIRGYLSASIR